MSLPPAENIILNGDIIGQLREEIKDIFDITAIETPRQAPQGTIYFIGNLQMEDSEAAYDIIAERWHKHQYTPLLRHHHGQVLLEAQAGLFDTRPANPWINLWLAVATIAAVWFTGAFQECHCVPSTVADWMTGLPMMLSMMVILGAHEFGHYFAAKYHKVHVTLPYFIPLPLLSPVGTLGAFIQLRSPFKTKKQLFDIGVAGPIGGLIFAIPLIFWGVANSPVYKLARGPIIIVSAGNDNTAQIWDLHTGSLVYSLVGHSGPVNSTKFNVSGNIVATASADETIRLWDVSSGEEILRLDGHDGPINSITFSPDDKTLASAGADQTVRLWDTSSGREIKRIEGHTGSVNSVVFSPDGKTLASAGADQTVRLWNIPSGQEIQRLDGHDGPVNSVAFSPNGKTLASAGGDQTARLWNVSSGREVKRFEGHTGSVNSVAFSPVQSFISTIFFPASETIATASSDQTVRLWKISSGKEVKRIEGHLGAITSISFNAEFPPLPFSEPSPYFRTVVTAASDNTVRLWNISTGHELDSFKGHTEAQGNITGGVLEGNSIFYLATKNFIHGQLLPNFDQYSDLPVAQEFALLLAGAIPAGGGTDILINSVAFAAWFGLFVTAMNLLPVGQLDGGHIVYSLIGERARLLGTVLVGIMVLAGIFWWTGWLVWAFLVFFVIGVKHPPPLNDLVALGTGRKILALAMIVAFIILFMPNPLQPL